MGALLALWACGDPLVGRDYHGEPLLTLEGQVALGQDADEADIQRCDATLEGCLDDGQRSCEGQDAEACEVVEAPCFDVYEACVLAAAGEASPWRQHPERLRLALFWATEGLGLGEAPTQGVEIVTSVEQSAVARGQFPARFSLTVHRPPPDAVIREGEGDAGRFAFAQVVLYLDNDGDGRWRAGADRLVGGAVGRGVLYTPDGLSSARLGEWAPGYHEVGASLSCEADGDNQLVLEARTNAPLELVLSAQVEFLRQLLLDFECDGVDDDFDICPDDLSEIRRLCEEDAADPWLCDICLDR